MNTTLTLTSPNLVTDAALPMLAQSVQIANATNQWLYLPSAVANIAPYTLQTVSLPGDTVGRVRQTAPSGRVQAATIAGEVVTLVYSDAPAATSAATPLTKTPAAQNEQWTSSQAAVNWNVFGAQVVSFPTGYPDQTLVDQIILSYSSGSLPVPELSITLCTFMNPGPAPGVPNEALILPAGEPIALPVSLPILYSQGADGNIRALVNLSGPSRRFQSATGVWVSVQMYLSTHVNSVITS